MLTLLKNIFMKRTTNYHNKIMILSKRFIFLYIIICVTVTERIVAQEYAIIPNTSVKEDNGSWFDGFEIRACNSQGATIKVTFYGTGIRWKGKRYADGGDVSVFVDGENKGSFSIPAMSANNNDIIYYDVTGLALGNHELTLTQTTSNTYINYSYFQNLSATITRNGNGWNTSGPIFNYCLNVGSSVTVNFTGNGIAWRGEQWWDAGIATFSIDGGAAEDVDVYGSQNQVPITWEKRNLSSGDHTLVCTVSGRKNSASGGVVFNYRYFEPLPSSDYTNLMANKVSKIRLYNNKLVCSNDLIGQQVNLYIYNMLGQTVFNKCIVISDDQIELPQLIGLNAVVVLDSYNNLMFSSKAVLDR